MNNMKGQQLRMYLVNDNLSGHWVAAYSPEDALDVLDGLNLDLDDEECFDRSDIVEVVMDKLLPIHTGTEEGLLTLTVAEWIARDGRGLIGSRDY